MIAMPYILVVIVLDMLSVPYFSLTTTALLYRRAIVRKYMPGWLSARAWVSFAVPALLLTALALGLRLIAGTGVFPIYAYVGFANSLVLVYLFLNKRCFLRSPNALRRLLNALLSGAIATAAVAVVQVIVVTLFVIR